MSNLLSGDGRALLIALGVVGFLLVLILFYVLYRTLFAHRLRPPGGQRARASRLGVVDVYGLDGQRQLVIVRRDNVEHLLMIGGPNDVVVEGNIVRSATNGAGAKPAAALPNNEGVAEPPPALAPRPVAPAAAAKRNNALPRAEPSLVTHTEPPVSAPRLEPEPVADPRPRPEIAKPAAPRAASNTVVSLSSRAAAEPAAAKPAAEPKPAPPVEPPAAVKPPAEPPSARRAAPAAKPPEATPRPSLPSPLRPRPVPEGARSAPTAPVEPPPKAAEPAPVAPQQAAPAQVAVAAAETAAVEKPVPKKEEAFYDLESLEAEMARLLGRDG